MNRLRELRLERGMTQKELGVKLKVQKSAISKYEIGRSSLTDDLIAQLCDIFDCSSDYLLGLSDIRACKNCPLTLRQGDRIVQKALGPVGLLSGDGSLPPKSEDVISDFLSRNADILKKLIQDNK